MTLPAPCLVGLTNLLLEGIHLHLPSSTEVELPHDTLSCGAHSPLTGCASGAVGLALKEVGVLGAQGWGGLWKEEIKVSIKTEPVPAHSWYLQLFPTGIWLCLCVRDTLLQRLAV